jgi:hypothetical protein
MATLTKFLENDNTKLVDQAKWAIFSFGRYNPPTRGHGKLIATVTALAEQVGGDHFIIPSRTIDLPLKTTGKINPKTSKNPLPFEIKVAFMRTLFPNANIVENAPNNPWMIPEWLGEQGYTDLKMVVGSDQINDFTRLSESVSSLFNSFEIVSAGVRNPDASDVTGMSATKARAAALINDIGAFRVATGWNGDVAEKLMEATRISMGAV